MAAQACAAIIVAERPAAEQAAATTVPTTATYPTGIILNEFLANPGTSYSDEWIELYNGGGAGARARPPGGARRDNGPDDFP